MCGDGSSGSDCCTGCDDGHRETFNKTCRTAGCGCETPKVCDKTDSAYLKYKCRDGDSAVLGGQGDSNKPDSKTCYY